MFSTSPTMLFLYCSTSKTTLASLAPVARSTSANSESRFLTGQLLTGTHFGPPLKFLTQRVVDALQASSAEINSDSRRSKFQLPLNGDTAFSVLDLSDFSPCNSRCSSRIKSATFPGVVAEEISELSQMKPSCEASLMEISSAQKLSVHAIASSRASSKAFVSSSRFLSASPIRRSASPEGEARN